MLVAMRPTAVLRGRCGKLDRVGGQEDMIVDVALTCLKRPERT
ncbi:hypothetical protein G3O07_02055 [Pseudomonas laurentiana]|uniref:DmpG-like communication domain-containing protein n=1 Tax=Pseudomonas laurentiana TaxID=2364649 RepID=A0A6I5RM47_9PSED|nr:hypothetical protein [Pseudomonas laurentiana]